MTSQERGTEWVSARRARLSLTAQRRRIRRDLLIGLTVPNGVIIRWREDDRHPPKLTAGSYQETMLALGTAHLQQGQNLLDIDANWGVVSFMDKSLVGIRGDLAAVELKVDSKGAEGAVHQTTEGPTVWGARPIVLVEHSAFASREGCRHTPQRWNYPFEATASLDDDISGRWCTMRTASV